jgi:hypothetical protein
MVILLTLLIRDLPYINVTIINKIWIIYLLLLLVLALMSIRFRYAHILLCTSILIFTAFVLELLSIVFVADMIGIFIYFLLWIILLHLTRTTFRHSD